MAGRVQWEGTVRVYLECESWMSLGIKRVAKALKTFAPKDVVVVEREEEADFTIVHMVGDGQRKHWLEPKMPYAVVQYCLRTTEFPNTKDWIPVWEAATAVWSYYDLLAKIVEDQNVTSKGITFYHAPLGADASVFVPSRPTRKTYIIGTSGFIAETEGVRECHEAARSLERPLFHLGPDLKLGVGVTYVTGVSDILLAELWSQCSFVAGLRRIEGFELPVVEGLLCGSRPIVFDAPHYRQWFSGYAEFIPEVESAEVVEHLRSIMSRPVRAVTAAERADVAKKFDWRTLATGFWEVLR